MTWDMSTRGIARIAHKGSKAMATHATDGNAAGPTTTVDQAPVVDGSIEARTRNVVNAIRLGALDPDEYVIGILFGYEAEAAAAARAALLDELEAAVKGLEPTGDAGYYDDRWVNRADVLHEINRRRP